MSTISALSRNPLLRLFKRKPLQLILLLSVLLRVGAAVYLGDQVEILPGTHDQISYDALAQNVAAGKGFVFDEYWYPFTPPNTPTAHWSFLYVLYLAAVYFITGHHPLIARVIQAVVVGVLMPWLVYRLGKRTFNRSIGLVGAAAISVYIYLVYYGASLMTEPFYIVTLLWILDTLQRITAEIRQSNGAGRSSIRKWVELGLGGGIAVLLRQQALALAVILFLWLLWSTWGHIRFRRLVGLGLISCAIIGGFILPWTIRNAVVYHSFLPLNSNVGFALFSANHPQQGNKFEPLNLPEIPAELDGMNEAEKNDWLTAEGIRFVVEDPGRFALQTFDRFRNYFRFWPEATSSTMANVSRVFSFGLYLPFMLYGLARAFRPGDKAGPRYRYDVTLLLLYAATYSAIHLLTWAMHRYRLPVDAVMMVFVGLALVDLWQRLAGRRRERLVHEAN